MGVRGTWLLVPLPLELVLLKVLLLVGVVILLDFEGLVSALSDNGLTVGLLGDWGTYRWTDAC